MNNAEVNEEKSIIFKIGDEEMLKISTGGFYVRGVQFTGVGREDREIIYNSFCSWLSTVSQKKNGISCNNFHIGYC